MSSEPQKSLTINHDGAYLTGSSVWGILHGLETFYQLVYGNDSDGLLVKEIDIIGEFKLLSVHTLL